MIAHGLDLRRLQMSGGRTTLDKITDSLLSEFAQEYGLESLPESKRFEHFAAYLIVRGEHSESFDTHDVVVGDDKQSTAGSDTGIDGVAVIVNGILITDKDELDEQLASAGYVEATFVFIQAETSSGFDGSKIGTFGFGVTDFFSDNPKLKRNSKISEAVEVAQAVYDKSSKFRRGNPVCKLFYVTTGKWAGDSALQARIDGVRSDLTDTGQFREVTFTPVGAEGLQKMYQRSKYAISAEFTFANRITIPEVPNVSEAHFGFLPWSEFKKLIVDDSDKLVDGLFFDNVRDWQGYNDVNNDIRATLGSTDRSRFVLMNNGVTIIARTLQPTGNKFTIEDYQIVNGCQTTHVLFDQRSTLNDAVAVPVKIISTKDEDVTNTIIKATNWQTEIREEQLFALQQFPKNLETYFSTYQFPHRLYFERRSRQYDSSTIEKTRVITFDAMIKAFAAMFLNEPQRTTKNFKSVKAKLGKEIFSKDQRMEPYYVAALALYKVEFLFRNKRLHTRYKPARFHMLTAIRILTAGYEMPPMGANKMEDYCKKISDGLQDPEKAERLILSVAALIDDTNQIVDKKNASNGRLDRDTIRTEPFTDKFIELTRKRLAVSASKAATQNANK